MLRPQSENELTIHDRTPPLFLADLINHYSSVFPPLLEKKKAESDRVMPVRKRTVLVDQRISRSRLSAETDPRELVEHQHALQNPPRVVSPSPTMTRMASATTLGLGIPLSKQREPEKEAFAESSVKVTPPTPQPPAAEVEKVPDVPVPTFPEDDSITSPTASILDHMEMLNSPNDGDATVNTNTTALTRATSGEVTRMRGPRGERCLRQTLEPLRRVLGARGPRPAPGRVPSQSAAPPSTAVSMSREVSTDGIASPVDVSANGEFAAAQTMSELMIMIAAPEAGLRRVGRVGTAGGVSTVLLNHKVGTDFAY